jgi:hypothetical protein
MDRGSSAAFSLPQGIPREVPKMTENSLYERLGGVLAIAAVLDHISDAVVRCGGGLLVT